MLEFSNRRKNVRNTVDYNASRLKLAFPVSMKHISK
jgi:hypothetical protein